MDSLGELFQAMGEAIMVELEPLIREVVRDELNKSDGPQFFNEVAQDTEEVKEVDDALSAGDFLAQVKETVGKDKENKDKARTLLSEKYGKSKFTDVDPALYEECLTDLKEELK